MAHFSEPCGLSSTNSAASLEKVKRQLNSASRTIEVTGVRSRAMDRKLRSIEQMPDGEAARILELPALSEEIETEETEAAADLEGER